MTSDIQIYIIKFYLNKIRYSKYSVDYVKRVLSDTGNSYFLKDFNDEEKANAPDKFKSIVAKGLKSA